MAAQVYHISSIVDALVNAVDAARAATTNRRWLNAIDAGYEWLLQRDAITFDVAAHELTYHSESGNTYQANGVCQCKAFQDGQACKHRAAARLVRRALETQHSEARAATAARMAAAHAAVLELYA